MDKYPSPVDLAVELIDIPSVTGSEATVLEFLEQWLNAAGFLTRREDVAPERWNLYAGWNDIPEIAFCTHVDTVPPHFPSRRKEGMLYGRGACDTKGIIAAMLFAGRHLLDDGHSPAFLFVVGEETDSLGAKTAARSGNTARYIVVGEPTDNMLATGHKGVLSYTLRTRGAAAHSAYPERGVSAVHLMLDLLDEIRREDWGHHPVLGESTLNVGLINGGVAMNTFAPEATATVMHRIVDDPDKRREQLGQLVGARADLEFHSVSTPQMLHTVEGFDSKAVAFGTDIPYLAAMGRCLLIGPGSVHDAHTPAERIEIAAIENAVGNYVKLFHALRRT